MSRLAVFGDFVQIHTTYTYVYVASRMDFQSPTKRGIGRKTDQFMAVETVGPNATMPIRKV